MVLIYLSASLVKSRQTGKRDVSVVLGRFFFFASSFFCPGVSLSLTHLELSRASTRNIGLGWKAPGVAGIFRHESKTGEECLLARKEGNDHLYCYL